jgi:protein TonB
MGKLIIKLQGPASRSIRPSHHSDGGARSAYSYNRSSAALAINETPSPDARLDARPDTRFATQPMPQPISPRGRAVLVPRGNSMFLGLDQRFRSRSRGSTVLSVSLHVVIIAAILWLGMAIHTPVVDTSTTVAPIQFTLYDPPPPLVIPVVKVRGGGGGGGAHQLVAPTDGSLPKVVVRAPIIPLEAPKINTPKLLVQPATAVQLPQDNPMPKLGAPHAQQVAMASQGPGGNNGFGFGPFGGIGSGHGTGQGPGSDRGYGGGIMSVGGGVSAPEVIHSVQPQFTAEARSQNFQGVVAVQLIVDSQGFPQDVSVVRHLGMGLDEEAITAVKQYRFRPAQYEGRAVSVKMVIDVDFRLD